MNLEERYTKACGQSSDMQNHVPRLYRLAIQCDHVTEFGTRHGVSTTAFLHAQPKKLVCYDTSKKPEVDELAKLAGRTEFVFHNQDVLKVDIEETDLLFIDTFHTYEQLSQELSLHGNKARKYIAMHDTEQNEVIGEKPGSEGLQRAIDEFLAHGTFKMLARYWDSCGMTVLRRR